MLSTTQNKSNKRNHDESELKHQPDQQRSKTLHVNGHEQPQEQNQKKIYECEHLSCSRNSKERFTSAYKYIVENHEKNTEHFCPRIKKIDKDNNVKVCIFPNSKCNHTTSFKYKHCRHDTCDVHVLSLSDHEKTKHYCKDTDGCSGCQLVEERARHRQLKKNISNNDNNNNSNNQLIY